MLDQASELRQLVLQAVQRQADANVAPRIIAVAGGQAGVGATTTAVNIAAQLTRQNLRVLLVNANFSNSVGFKLFFEPADHGLYSILLDEKTVTEATTVGPLAMPVLDMGRTEEKVDITREMQQKLFATFRDLHEQFDYIVMDVGCETSAIMRRFLVASHFVLLVTKPTDQAIMDTYAMIKTLVAGHGVAMLRTVVNQVEDEQSADQIHQRMECTCQRFLGYQLQNIGHVVLQPSTSRNTEQTAWFMADPNLPAAGCIENITKKMLATIEQADAAAPGKNQAENLARSLI